jgi:hypothetical protein
LQWVEVGLGGVQSEILFAAKPLATREGGPCVTSNYNDNSPQASFPQDRLCNNKQTLLLLRLPNEMLSLNYKKAPTTIFP